MRDALVAKGVPVGAMTLDYAGFRTLDTVVRASDVFGLRRCIFVTDDFHLSRTLYLAEHYGLDAIGYETKPLAWGVSSKTRLREYLARVKAVLDVNLLGTQPKFLGEKIILPGTGKAS
jgi:SanA protein